MAYLSCDGAVMSDVFIMVVAGGITRFLLCGLISTFLKWKTPWWGSPIGFLVATAIVVYATVTGTTGEAGTSGYIGFFLPEFLFGLFPKKKKRKKK